MGQINRTVLITLIFLFMVGTESGEAQVLGSPIKSLLSNEVGMGLTLETIHRPMDVGSFSSARLWLKGSYGITDWWTLSGLAGGANIYFNPPVGDQLTTFRGSFEWAYGGSTKMALLRAGGLRTFSAGKVLFTTEETLISLRYDWAEFWGGGGLLHEGEKWLLYGAVEERQVRWIETRSKRRTVSAIAPNIIGGFAYHITPTFCLNMQFKFLNEYSFVLGLSEHSFLQHLH